MLQIGITDAFERNYMQRFRAFAGKFGEFVTYERDRGARDIGLHLTHKLASGKERMSTALCWFQMKGVMATTLTPELFKKAKSVKLSLDVNHLGYWFLQPTPTYLVVYVESMDKFLICDIQAYVASQWGRAILTLDQKTATVEVDGSSELDEQAFNLILTKNDINEWTKALDTDEESAKLCRRDYDLIWQLGTSDSRNVRHRVMFWDWQSKARGQFYIQEQSTGDESKWATLREHWQYMMGVCDLERAYPYLEFFALDTDDEDSSWFDDENDNDVPDVELYNGDVVSGVNCSYEYFEYLFGAKLNELGQELLDSVTVLQQVGLIEITPGKEELISVAPWHGRSV